MAEEVEVDDVSELEGIRRGLEAGDAGGVRPVAEAAEMRARYNLPTHLSNEEIVGGDVGGLFVDSCG